MIVKVSIVLLSVFRIDTQLWNVVYRISCSPGPAIQQNLYITKGLADWEILFVGPPLYRVSFSCFYYYWGKENGSSYRGLSYTDVHCSNLMVSGSKSHVNFPFVKGYTKLMNKFGLKRCRDNRDPLFWRASKVLYRWCTKQTPSLTPRLCHGSPFWCNVVTLLTPYQKWPKAPIWFSFSEAYREWWSIFQKSGKPIRPKVKF